MADRKVVTEYKGATVTSVIPEMYDSKQIMAKLRTHMRAAHNEATKEGIRILKDAIILQKATSSKKLLNSVTSRYVEGKHPTSLRLETEIGWFTGEASDYANVANYGRGPGGVHWGRILAWAARKNWSRSSAWGVYKKIRDEGSPGKHFIEIAVPKIDRLRDRLYEEALSRFISEYGRG